MMRVVEIIEAAIKTIEFEKSNLAQQCEYLQAQVLRMEKQWQEEKADHNKTKAKVFRTKELMNEIVKIFGSEKSFEAVVEKEHEKRDMRALWRRMITEDWEWSW